MHAIAITRPAGPEVLKVVERPDPVAAAGEVPEITGIECVGEVRVDSQGQLSPGQKVIALMGGMGRTRDGSYAQSVTVPSANVRKAATGAYRSQPARVFAFDEIAAAHRLMESNGAGGKIVVKVPAFRSATKG